MNDITRAFVVCPPFHGATLLSLLLNQHPEITALGDTVPRNSQLDYWCSCGVQISDCEFWQTLIERVATTARPANAHVIPLLPEALASTARNDWLWRYLLETNPVFRAVLKRVFGSALADFVRVSFAWQNVACELQGTRVCVDGAKRPPRFALLKLASNAPMTLIHVVRDPRAFVHSYRKNITSDIELRQITELWRNTHQLIANLEDNGGRYRSLAIRYEDLCASTEAVMAKLFETLGVAPFELPGKAVDGHHVIGNRMLAAFDGTVELDQRYMTLMSAEEQREILAMTEPLASRWNYA